AFWRVFVAQRIKDIADAQAKYDLEHKIDMIFSVASQHFRSSHPAKNKLASSTDVDAITQAWKFAGEPSRAGQQSKWMTRATELAFIIGSLLTLAGKFLQSIGS
ncbi:MAG TPA: hypothetical protein VFM46_11465, partial [Pseudomonadales bacterium]|nr:hypothetical protein [Pseudomonadales bacterium]